METLKKVVTNQYFPAGAVLTAVLLFWVVGMLGGLSLLNNNQPPLTTLTWMLFVYAAAVLTPLAGLLAGADLVRRWRRNRAAAPAQATSGGPAAGSLSEPAPSASQAQAAQGVPASSPAASTPTAAEPPATQPKPQRPGRKEAA
ncbi:hypothetical protein AB0284_07560 [Pseudarthrobacter phenanthrenivorans]|uniref:hypothetical protein n=1 Tax=Pseudarthrobacter phenanthrenivorans TaxID=361575 RepID=UPI00344FFE1D